MRIVFMGTPEYSVKTLKALKDAGHDVVAVFAQPDKPVGRKQILTAPPVKQFAEENSITVYQPKTLRDGSSTKILKEIAPDVIVVVAYGKILPKDILDIPKYGCINGHASLLPRHRGASPIQWAIVSGDKKTGVTTMLMDEGMDTGDILEVAETPIYDEETADELFERLSYISADLMVKTLEKIENGTAVLTKQTDVGVTYAPIIKKEMALIDFNKPAESVHDLVRGFYSWPCAYFILDGKRIKVHSCKVSSKTEFPAGTVISENNSLFIACKDGTSVELLTIQPEGSKPMSASQMLCGRKIPTGTKVNC